jgi:hypothetical protein
MPTNLNECHIELDKILNETDKVYIQLEGSGSVHDTLGRWIRNN